MDQPLLADKITFYSDLEGLEDERKDEFSESEKNHRSISREFNLASSVRQKKIGHDAARGILSATLPTSASMAITADGVIKGTPIDTRKSFKPGLQEIADGPKVSFVTDTPLKQPRRPLEPPGESRRTASSHLPAGNVTANLAATRQRYLSSASSGKRKRSSLAEQLEPPAARLFNGLAFFYIPNNDRNKVRKLRISKACEHGAAWVREVRSATHIIVDKGLVWKDVEPAFDNTSMEGIKVVCDEYPVDCVSLGAVLDALQPKYRIQGQPAPSAPPKVDRLTADASTEEDASLSLGQIETRPARWDYNVPRDTPPRSEQTPSGERNAHGNHGKIGEAGSSNDWVIPSSFSEQDAEVQEVRTDEGPVKVLQSDQSTYDDELVECIAVAQQTKGLPLDEEQEDEFSGNPEGGRTNDESDEIESPDVRVQKRRQAEGLQPYDHKNVSFQQRFACFAGGIRDQADSSKNPNARTIEILQQMCDYYMRTNDHFRSTKYRKVITTLKRQKVKIATKEQALPLPGVGVRLAEKIEEIVATNRLQRLEHAQKDTTSIVFDRFYKVYGVGTSQANKWIAQGFKTIDDLVKRATLNPSQRIGIEHYEDLNTRIPRAEVTALGDCVKAAASRIDPKVELLIGGSYRRGAESSGDIDFIITKKDTKAARELLSFLESLVSQLEETGFIVATLASFHSLRFPKPDTSGSKWHGCCVLPQEEWDRVYPGMGKDKYKPVWRRIDFLLVPETEYGAALIYFTGNDIFNRSIRLLASKKRMRLNQRGLYRSVLKGPHRTTYTDSELLEGRSEKRIFDILGVQWRPPHERWC
jgi:DNA polymerase IV